MDPVTIATTAVSVYNVAKGIFGGGKGKSQEEINRNLEVENVSKNYILNTYGLDYTNDIAGVTTKEQRKTCKFSSDYRKCWDDIIKANFPDVYNSKKGGGVVSSFVANISGGSKDNQLLYLLGGGGVLFMLAKFFKIIK